MKDTTLCRGCYNDFYNGQGAKECWSLERAEVVKRFKLAWWTAPTVPKAFTEVETYSCWHSPGKYALYKILPTFAVDPVRLKAAVSEDPPEPQFAYPRIDQGEDGAT